MEEYGKRIQDIEMDDEIMEQAAGNLSSDDEDEERKERDEWSEAYMDELACEYVVYTYATVIEFTQDDGCIGLPASIASALLQSCGEGTPVDSKLTTDPASISKTRDGSDNDEDPMDVDEGHDTTDDDLDGKTPGHAAYGLFPVPVAPVEVSLLTHLPIGKKCTLRPTATAVKSGFYNLKNVDKQFAGVAAL